MIRRQSEIANGILVRRRSGFVTLIGLTAYLLLFEVWPRYLFLYAPFFVILSSLAFDKPDVTVVK